MNSVDYNNFSYTLSVHLMTIHNTQFKLEIVNIYEPCLQYMLPKNISRREGETTKVVNGEKN